MNLEAIVFHNPGEDCVREFQPGTRGLSGIVVNIHYTMVSPGTEEWIFGGRANPVRCDEKNENFSFVFDWNQS